MYISTPSGLVILNAVKDLSFIDTVWKDPNRAF